MSAVDTPVALRSPSGSPPPPSFRWVVALAVVLSGALAIGLWQAATGGASATGEPAPSPAQTRSNSGAAADEFPELSFPRREVPALAIELHGTESALWEIEHGPGQAFTLKVLAGQVLVEFLPMADTTLRVQSGSLDFDVVGTVVVVSNENERPAVDVLYGEVSIRGAGHVEAKTVRARQRYQDGETAPMDVTRFVAITQSVDLEMHEARLEILRALENASDGHERSSRRGVSDPLERPPARPRLDAPELPPASALERARAAMERRRWAEAASAFEEAIREEHAPGEVRRELAQLYTQRLNAPVRAISHLRTFVLTHPEHPEVDAALRELCRLSDRTGQDELLCD